MDIENLIEQLNRYFEGETLPRGTALDAATALSTLKDENESLKEKLYDGEGVNLVDYWMQQAKIEENGHRNCQAENEKLRAELEKVKAERDAAVSDMEALMWFSGEGCRICAHAIEVHKEPYVRLDCNREKGTDCCPKWRGPQKED